MRASSSILAGVLIVAATSTGRTASLQVAPVSIEIQAPGASATVRLRNEGSAPIHAQLRVFRWSQVNGEEKLEPTDDVVASPPMTTLMAKADYTVRLVRTTKAPLSEEENYRLLVDELPNPAAAPSSNITLVLRYSIPVFFYGPNTTPSKLSWSIEQRGGRTSVTVANAGSHHARISGLRLNNGNTTVVFGAGLNGYALGRSTMRWVAPAGNPRLGGGSAVVLTGQADSSPINVSANVRAAP